MQKFPAFLRRQTFCGGRHIFGGGRHIFATAILSQRSPYFRGDTYVLAHMRAKKGTEMKTAPPADMREGPYVLIRKRKSNIFQKTHTCTKFPTEKDPPQTFPLPLRSCPCGQAIGAGAAKFPQNLRRRQSMYTNSMRSFASLPNRRAICGAILRGRNTRARLLHLANTFRPT